MTDLLWIALSLQPHIGIKTLNTILHFFDDDLSKALKTDIQTLRRIPGIGPKIARTMTSLNLDAIARQLEAWQALGVGIYPAYHPEYPARLHDVDDMPAAIFQRGIWQESLWQKTAALVGTRTPSQLARSLTERLAVELANQGYTIVSGLAHGVDAIAHDSAMQLAHWHTVAVLGSGVLNIYPPQNQALADRIIQQGTLLCESPPDAGVNSARLVARNRIISGLSQHVIVIETGMDGGAMYAARAARLQKRHLYALDLPASGNQRLISEGATAIRTDLQGFRLQDL